MSCEKSSNESNLIVANENLIFSKLHLPTLPPNFVKRPQLLERLHEGFNYKLILVSAAAGYGKTTLLADWCNGLKKQKLPQKDIVWFTVDEIDNDPFLFWTHILTAVDLIWKGIKEDVSLSLQLIQSKSVEQFLTVLINYLSHIVSQPSSAQKHYVLVFDNYHLIHNKEIHKSLSFLIDLIPSEIHLVISTQVTPQLPLARFRARNQLLELTASDLMFSHEEASIFLNEKMGLTLSTEEISALQDYVEGWIIGLQLSALSIRENIRKTKAGNRYGNRYIEEFLLSEVFDGLTEEITNFLLETSNFTCFNSALYDSIKKTNHSQSLIEQLELLNLFIIPLDNDGDWYRYHHFFRDFLQKRFKAYRPLQETDLHLRASKWFEKNGFMSEAIEQALCANDIDYIVHLISSVGNLPYHQDIYAIYKWLKKIPTATIRANQALSKLAAWTFIYLGCPKDSSEWFTHELPLEEDKAGHTRIETECIEALGASLSGNYDLGIQLCNKLLDEFEESSNQNMWMQCLLFHSLGESYERVGCLEKAEKMYMQARIISELDGSVQVSLFCSYELGLMQYLHGNLRHAVETYQQALKDSTTNSFAGGLYSGLGRVQLEWNNIEQAAFNIGKAVKILSLSGNIDMLLEAYIAQVQLLMAQQKHAEASELIMKAVYIADNNIIPRGVDLQVLVCQARLALVRGNVFQAEKIEKRLASKVSALDITNFLSWQCVRVRILMAENKMEEALELLSELSLKADKGKLVSVLLEMMVLKVICFQALRKKSQAMIQLIEALKLAAKQGYIRVFLNEGNTIGMLLYEILYDRRTDQVSSIFKKSLLQAFVKAIPTLETQSETVNTLNSLNEPLTERELEILTLLNQGMSRQEISEYLKITINTAKSHIKNIYNKLEVHNRSDLFRASVENKLS